MLLNLNENGSFSAGSLLIPIGIPTESVNSLNDFRVVQERASYLARLDRQTIGN